ncbi:MAG: cytochrome c biogenesis protein CcsA [Polyangiales bacterium]
MVATFFVAAAVAYAVSSALYLLTLTRGTDGPGRFAHGALLLAVVLHGVYLGFDYSSGGPPMGRVHQTLTFLSLGIVGAFLIAGLRRKSIAILGAFITPVALFFFLGAGLGRSVDDVSDDTRSTLLPFHIGVNVLGLVAFALAFGSAVAYVIQERMLRQKKLSGVFERLPALDVLDGFSLRAVSVGFPLLTIGVVTGAFWATRVQQGVLVTSPQAFGLASWVLFAGVLVLRLAAGWRGRRAAIGTIVGFLCAAAVLVGYALRDGALT